MDCYNTQTLMPLNEALTQLQGSLSNVCGEITLPISDALGFYLSQPVVSRLNVPPFDNSAMDGYAVRVEDLTNCSDTSPVKLTMVGKSFAGVPYEGEIPRGTCIRIMTGAVIPDSLNGVVMQEQCIQEGEQIIFTSPVKMNSHIRFAAEDLKIGQQVLEIGHKLTPRDIPLLASLGIVDVNVFRKLKVAVFSSGDELKPLGELLAPGQIYDTNRYSIKALFSKLNVDVLDMGIIKDDYALIKNALIKANVEADIVITSGGVSVGEADFIKNVLDEIGEIGFWKLAIKPGKPFAFGKLQNSVFFGLPGNPVSAIVTLYQLVVPAITKMGGGIVKPAIRLNAITTHDLPKRAGRTDFQRGNYSIDDEGKLVVNTTGNQGSGIFSSMSQSNCFIVLEQERGAVMSGERVTIEPYNTLMD